MRSRSSGVLRTCAATDVAWPGRMGTAKLVALGEVVALEVAMLVLGVLLGADVTVVRLSMQGHTVLDPQPFLVVGVWMAP